MCIVSKRPLSPPDLFVCSWRRRAPPLLQWNCAGRRDNHGSDLREKLDRRHSPLRKYSPGRDERGRHVARGDSPRSTERIRKRRKKEQLDGEGDLSGSLRFSEGFEDKVKGSRQTSSESKEFLDEQLRRAQSEISMLEDHKRKLEDYLEERIKEASGLNLRIQDLEMHLSQEKEESKRITSKIKKFIKAYNRQSRLEDELKRSRAQLEKMTEQLALDANQPGADEEDPGLNHVSGGDARTSRNELHKNVSPSNRRLRVQNEGNEVSTQANRMKGEGIVTGKNRVEKLSRWSTASDSKRNNKPIANINWMNMSRPSTDEYNSKRTEIMPTDVAPSDKCKVTESFIELPLTSMAANAIEDDVDIIEMDEKLEMISNTTRSESEVTFKIPRLALPPLPPPPVPENAYAQYKGDDENVEIEGAEEEMVEVDIV